MSAQDASGNRVVTIAQADWILFNRRDLYRYVATMMPQTSKSIVGRGVTGGVEESPIETTAIERAQISLVLGEAENAIIAYSATWTDERRRRAMRQVITLWYGDPRMTWEQISRRVYYCRAQCRRFRDSVRRVVAARLATLPGTSMPDFWRAIEKRAACQVDTRSICVLPAETPAKMSTFRRTFRALKA